MDAKTQRYSTIAIWLHWLMAVAILLMIGVGMWMVDAVNVTATQASAYAAFQLHKSLGLTLLVLALARLVWRATHRVPPLPEQMPGWQKVSARIMHMLFYAFMLLLPLTGWLYVSTGWSSKMDAPFDIPTVWFGLFQWPHIPGVSGAKHLAGPAIEMHELLAWGMLALLALHILAALKHHFADRDHVLWSMLPFIRRPVTPSETTSGTAQQ